MKKLVVAATAAALLCAVVTAPAYGATGKRDASPAAQTATKKVPTTCEGARKAARFLAVRYKKIRKRARFDPSLRGKVNQAYRDYKTAVRWKNRICGGGGGGGPPTTPLALTATEVANRVFQQAGSYCNSDIYCYSYGNYDTSTCASKSTYTWICYGYNLETYGDVCDFREVVSRSGYNGLTSYRDGSYGFGGWYCV